MGKKKVAIFDLSQSESAEHVATGTRGKKISIKTTDQPAPLPPLPPTEPTPTPETASKKTAPSKDKKAKKAKPAKPTKTKKRVKHPRSQRYQQAKQLIDKTQAYSIPEAIKLLRQVSQVKFDASVELHLNLAVDKLSGEFNLPHGTGKSQTIEIASDKTLAKLKDNLIDFDILIATPQIMPKLAKFAKLLGPKGLMPNPKAGTITDDPQAAQKKLSSGSLRFKSEPKAPLIHLIIGKLSFKDNQLEDNLNAALKTILPKNISSAYLCSSMSPSIKLKVKN